MGSFNANNELGFFAAERQALQWLAEQCEPFGIKPPDHIQLDCKVKLGLTAKEREGSPVYWAKRDNNKIIVTFHTFKGGEYKESKVFGNNAKQYHSALTPQEIADQALENAKRLEQQQATAAELAQATLTATQEAQQQWDNAKQAIEHPYLFHKRIQPHLAKIDKDANTLLIPVFNANQQIQSVQKIFWSSKDQKYVKLFFKGAKAGGGFCTLNDQPEPQLIYIAEGFATAATITECSGEMTVVAFDAGNLLPVAKIIREKHPNVEIILCADDDWKTDKNPGLTKACEAALAIDGKVVKPQFLGLARGDKDSDFNDSMLLGGLEYVQAGLENFVDLEAIKQERERVAQEQERERQAQELAQKLADEQKRQAWIELQQQAFVEMQQVFDQAAKDFNPMQHCHYLLSQQIKGNKTLQDYAKHIHGVRYTSNQIIIPLFHPKHVKDTTGITPVAFAVIDIQGEVHYVGNSKGAVAIIGTMPGFSSVQRIYTVDSITTGLKLCKYKQPVMCFDPKFLAINVAAVRTQYKKAEIVIASDAIKNIAEVHTAAIRNNCTIESHGTELMPNPNQAFMQPIQEDAGDKHLSKIDLQPGITLVKSGIGTGKTEAINGLISQWSSVLYITTLISLTTNAANRLNLQLYNEEKVEVATEKLLSIVINSIFKLGIDKPIMPREAIVLDEIEALLERLTTFIELKNRILGALEFLLRNAKYIILLDAHLGPLTREWLQVNNYFGHGKPHEIVNPYRVGVNRTIKVYHSKGLVIDKAIQSLRKNITVFMACNYKSDAVECAAKFKNACPNKKILCINGDNNGDAEVLEFFSNPNKYAAKYDAVTVSPSCSTGVSIDSVINDKGERVAAFGFVGGIMHDLTTHTQAIQMLGRVRDTTEIHLAIETRQKKPLRTDAEIQASWKQARRELKEGSPEAPALKFDANGELTPENAQYAKLCLAVTKNHERSVADYKVNLLRELVAQGYTVQMIQSSKKELKQAKTTAIEAKQEANKIYLDQVTNAAEINRFEAAVLEKQARHTQVETDNLTKHKIVSFYSGERGEEYLPMPLPKLIEFDQRGSTRKAIARLSHALLTHEEIAQRQQNQVDKLPMEADRKPIVAMQEWVLILLNLLMRLVNIGTYTKDHEAILQFIELVNKNRDNDAYRSVVNIPEEKLLRAMPLKFIGEQLRRIGLSQYVTTKAKGPRTYAINAERLDKIRNILLNIEWDSIEKQQLIKRFLPQVRVE